jgi:pyrroloquinoline quinone biosynthesis protein B
VCVFGEAAFLLIRVLGSAAGGGFPQWNCGCLNCRGAREKSIRATPRTQESVALSADGAEWFLLNASPEIRQQIEGFPPLHPRAPRHSPIRAILLTNGDLDHCLGLLSLRESHPIVVYATDAVRQGFTECNVLYRTLERFHGQVTWRILNLGQEQELKLEDGKPSGLSVEAIPVPGKAPLHLEALRPAEPADNVALRLRERARDRVLAYASAVGRITPAVRAALSDADCVFFDGTFWSGDELISGGVGTKRADEMAHVPVGGADGSLEGLGDLRAARKVFIHVNNTNPLLREDAPQRATAEAAGWEVAWDGMEVEL